jgi:hypothetical protein
LDEAAACGQAYHRAKSTGLLGLGKRFVSNKMIEAAEISACVGNRAAPGGSTSIVPGCGRLYRGR